MRNVVMLEQEPTFTQSTHFKLRGTSSQLKNNFFKVEVILDNYSNLLFYF